MMQHPPAPFIRYRPRTETKRIILHDSHTKADILTVRDVPRWADLAKQEARRMGLMDIGYHAIIERDGTTVFCRDLTLIGSHCPGHNMDSIGLCLVGGRDDGHMGVVGRNNFLPIQLSAAFQFISQAEKTFGPLRLVGHSEVQKYRNKRLPPCPMLDMDQFRDDYAIFKQMGVVL